MKKWLLITVMLLSLSTVISADENSENDYINRDYYGGHMMDHGYGGGYMMGGHMMGPGYGSYMMDYRGRRYGDENYMLDQRRLTAEEERAYIEIRKENLKIYNKYGRAIKEKQLNIEMELLKDSPDWKKIQKLNEEIGVLGAKARTDIMKKNYDSSK